MAPYYTQQYLFVNYYSENIVHLIFSIWCMWSNKPLSRLLVTLRQFWLFSFCLNDCGCDISLLFSDVSSGFDQNEATDSGRGRKQCSLPWNAENSNGHWWISKCFWNLIQFNINIAILWCNNKLLYNISLFGWMARFIFIQISWPKLTLLELYP